MPLQSTSGAASYDAFGGGAAAKVNYIEDFFQSYLRTGTGASATVTTGLDGSTKETLVWTKSRSAATNHKLTDNVRGATKALSSNTAGAEATDSQGLTAFSATGYTLGTNTDYNNSGATYVDWQWIAQPKFFDVVTYTGNGSSSQAISHSLGSVPACVIFKKLNNAEDWTVWHRSLSTDQYLILNSTSAVQTLTGLGPAAGALTSTTITVPEYLNSGSQPFVAYLFAHDAGGFGLTGTDNVISCGSYTGVGGGNVATITLGYEPQWILVKRTDNSAGGNWAIFDNMRGMSVNSTNNASMLNPNVSDFESVLSAFKPTATGFQTGDNFTASGGTYIYIAIRRGPMKVPTSGTSVFAPLTYTGNGTSGRYISGAGFPPDLIIQTARSASENREFDDRLRGGGSTAMNALFSNSTNAEAADSGSVQLLNQDGFNVRSFGNGSSVTYIGECFRRAPSFFDEVCWTGTINANASISHNLGAVPELIIIKPRNNGAPRGWRVYIGSVNTYIKLESTDAVSTIANCWTSTPPTSTTFNINEGAMDVDTFTMVAYLFATCAGVQYINSYVGDGTTGRTINCGFTGGARFVCIKATSTSGSWWTFDSARGIVTNSDPALQLNSTAAEVTSADAIDTASSGFIVNQEATCSLNASGVSYLVWAIA